MFNFGLEEEPSIDLTPLIDTIFMLLIFFIMTTTFSRPVLDIILPASSEAEASAEKREQVISIKADGSLHYEGRMIDRSEVDAILAERPEALLNLCGNDDVMVMGGAAIYQQLLPYCDSCYITKIDCAFDADAYMIDLDERDDFRLAWQSGWMEEKGISYQFTRYDRINI